MKIEVGHSNVSVKVVSVSKKTTNGYPITVQVVCHVDGKGKRTSITRHLRYSGGDIYKGASPFLEVGLPISYYAEVG